MPYEKAKIEIATGTAKRKLRFRPVTKSKEKAYLWSDFSEVIGSSSISEERSYWSFVTDT